MPTASWKREEAGSLIQIVIDVQDSRYNQKSRQRLNLVCSSLNFRLQDAARQLLKEVTLRIQRPHCQMTQNLRVARRTHYSTFSTCTTEYQKKNQKKNTSHFKRVRSLKSMKNKEQPVLKQLSQNWELELSRGFCGQNFGIVTRNPNLE